MKIFNIQSIEINADDLRLIVLKKFMDQFDANDNAVEVKFIIDSSTKIPVLKGVKLTGKSAMEI